MAHKGNNVTAERGISAIRDEKCPFCALPVTYSVLGNRIGVSVSCPCCGTYKLSAEAETALPHWSYPDENWAAASYQIRRIADRDGPLLTQEALREILNHSTLAGPSEALDGIVIWLATNSRWPGNYVEMRDPFQRAIFGAFNASAFEAMQDWLLATGWVSGEVMNPMDGPGMNALLTPAGWERYRYLRTSGIGSRKAFMAMPFGFEDLNSVVSECFVPAVKQAGFDLQRVIDGQGAGLIDDQMRVRIRTSR